MPSKEDICIVNETLPTKKDICVVQETLPINKDFLTADVEELVAAIKHNLQLKSKPRHSMCNKQRRMSPYAAPVRTVCRHNSGDKENTAEHSSYNCKYCILRARSPISNSSDDPYEMLQGLLREGSLIKEAVKRLQFDLDNKRPKKQGDYYDFEYEISENQEIESI